MGTESKLLEMVGEIIQELEKDRLALVIDRHQVQKSTYLVLKSWHDQKKMPQSVIRRANNWYWFKEGGYYTDSEIRDQLVWRASNSVYMRELAKQPRDNEGFRNGVRRRDNVTSRPLCQVCGVRIEKGDEVIQGFRRLGTCSNRTGYAHIGCLDHLEVKPGEKLVRRQIRVSELPEMSPSSRIEDSYPKTCGCRLSRNPTCVITGKPATHVIWVGMSRAQESVPFHVDALERWR